MSRESVELRTLIEHADMSGTSSFSSPPVTQGQTDGVGPVGPFYQTVTDARTVHHQVRNSSPQQAHEPTVYAVPSESDPLNEYDLISEKQVARGQRSAAQSSAKHLETENILYTDSQGAANLKHATLNMDRGSMRFSGPISSALVEPGDGGTSGFRWSTVFLVFFLFVVFVMALAVLILVLLVWFGVHTPPCACPAAGSTTVPVEQTTEPSTTDVNVEQLRSNLSDLEMMVVMLEGQLGQTLVEGVNYPVTLSGVTLNSECTTDFEELCTVMPPSEVPGSSNISCPDTPFNVTADEEQKGKTVADIKCVRYGNSTEANPFVTTLRDSGDGLVDCQCYLVAPSASFEPKFDTQCAMIVTRCPTTQDLNGSLQT